MDDNLAGAASDAMEQCTGSRPGYRRAHPRGLVCHATFTAAPDVKSLTIAEHFQGGSVAALVRFSNASGSPYAPDRDSEKSGKVMGLAVRFTLASGATASWAAASLPAFVASSARDFLQVTRAQKPSFLGKPNPLRALAYFLPRPRAFSVFRAIVSAPPSPSLGNLTFNGVHTYYLVDSKGARRPFRYRWLPRLGAAALSQDEARALPKQYLLEELRARLAKGPMIWDLSFEFPTAQDPLDDPTRVWSGKGGTIVAGELTVTRVDEDQRGKEGLVFDPTGVTPGLELSDDPVLRFRAEVYRESHRRRSRETRVGPAPPDMGQ